MLDQGSVMVIYGRNGSGKTGYARLLKELCGLRTKDDALIGNVYNKAAEKQETPVSLTIDGEKQPLITWSKDDGAIKPLVSAVHIFDSVTASLFVDKSSPATHEPRAMRFLSGLISISDRVADELRIRSAELASTLPAMPDEFSATTADTFLRSLCTKTSLEDITDACDLPETIDEEIARLEAALAETDQGGQLSTLLANILRNEGLRGTLDSLMQGLSDEAISARYALRVAAADKRQAATTFARQFFEGMPLNGVGEATWRQLWAHAKAYSENVAYVGHTHPVVDDDALCVLCQQPLEEQAKARMLSFENYLTKNLETEAADAEAALNEATTKGG